MKAILFWLLLIPFSAWAVTAIWVQFPATRILAIGGFVTALIAVIWLRLVSQWGWAGLAVLAAAVAIWYGSLMPSQNRNWAADVMRIVKGVVVGDRVYLENIRAFRWQTAEYAPVQDWRSREFDLRDLEGADVITSSWGNPDIAHLLVSFRFKGVDPITFSVEIRREEGESFSAIGGFFRQFELSLIAADEDDIVHWRAVPREEDVYLYPLNLTQEQLRDFFLRFIDLGNDLNAEPVWYNTLTANCVTVVWQLAKVIKADLPLDISLLLPGRLPAYIEKFGVLGGEGSLEEKQSLAAISQKARNMPEGADFSAHIRD